MPPNKGHVTARAGLCLLTHCLQALCRALHRPALQNPHQTQNTTQELCTDYQHRIWPRQSEQVLSPGLKDEGSIKIYRLPESSLNGGIKRRISWGREGRALAAAGGQRGADFVLAGWGARAPVNHCPTVIYCIPPGACRPLGMSHLLPAHSSAPAHSSLPRERTPQSHVLPSAKSHAVERRLCARKLGQFQLSAPAEELPNVSACKSSAQIKVPGEAGDWLCQPVLQQTQCSLSAGSCLKKLPERMKPSILQACITLHSGEG